MDSVRLRTSASVSLLIHLLLLAGWVLTARQVAKTPPSARPEWFEVALTPPQADAKRLEKVRENPERRVVQTDRGQVTQEAAPQAMLGEKTQVVDRQTVSREQKIQMASGTPPAQQRARGAEAPRLSQFGIPILDPKTIKGVQEGEWRDTQVFSPQDYIRGINESDRTALNTKEYVFYGYFQRIRQRLDLAWTSTLKDQLTKLYKRGRQLASEMDHTTKVLVTLNAGGEVVRVQIVEESGTRDLDDAAVRAFNQAGPFPNPPQGIVDERGLIQIRWDFVLKT